MNDMLARAGSSGCRHDSGMGHSSGSDMGSMSSEGGSVTQSMDGLKLQQSVSFEDNVFQGKI